MHLQEIAYSASANIFGTKIMMLYYHKDTYLKTCVHAERHTKINE